MKLPSHSRTGHDFASGSGVIDRRHIIRTESTHSVNLPLPGSLPTKHYFPLPHQPLAHRHHSNSPSPLYPGLRSTCHSTTNTSPPRQAARNSPAPSGASQKFMRRPAQLTPLTPKQIRRLQKCVPQTQNSPDAPLTKPACRSAHYARTCARHIFANSVNASGFLWPSNRRTNSHAAQTK